MATLPRRTIALHDGEVGKTQRAMAQEIERKYLLQQREFLEGRQGTYYRQGYVATVERTTVRVRMAGEKGFLTLKGPTTGISRLEFEYEIPRDDAAEMLSSLCIQPTIEKNRYLVEHEGFTWEVDEFLGENQGLFVAELELSSESQEFPTPPWLGQEVSGVRRYYNSSLVKHPFSRWSAEEK